MVANEILDTAARRISRCSSRSAKRPHAETVIAMDDKPCQALRKGRGKSSMWAALQSVKDGEADVAISGGNTGALMAMATFCLRPMEGISRPAIAAIWPTLRTDIVVLDVGRDRRRRRPPARRFLHSRRGAGARPVRPGSRPSIGLLNVGTEEMKGLDEVKEAGAHPVGRTSGAGFIYHGFVEGDDIGKGTVDVVVTEGFTGNIALKTAEGTARQVGTYLRNALKADLLSQARRAARRAGAAGAAGASWTRATSMAACSSASTASSSRAMAAPTRSASRAPSAWPTRWRAAA